MRPLHTRPSTMHRFTRLEVFRRSIQPAMPRASLLVYRYGMPVSSCALPPEQRYVDGLNRAVASLKCPAEPDPLNLRGSSTLVEHSQQHGTVRVYHPTLRCRTIRLQVGIGTNVPYSPRNCTLKEFIGHSASVLRNA
jgi:hypothetical protein